MIKPFDTIVFQLFLDLLRASGMGLNQQQIEKLRSASHQFAEAFKAEAQLACMDYMKEFQANVKEAIEALENKLSGDRKPETSQEEMNRMADSLSYGREERFSDIVDKSEKTSDN